MARFTIYIAAFIFRRVAEFFAILDTYFSHPLPQPVSFTRTIRTTVGSARPASIDLLFYTPPSYPKPQSCTSSETALSKGKISHPLLVNFHGGGYMLGHARDDARWATAVTQRGSAVVVSVNYRLAPRYPFPTGLEDCVSAVLWLWTHADELNLDISRTAFSGFSAGGNFCYTVAMRLQEELLRMKEEKKLVVGLEKGKIVALAAFYGTVDRTITPQAKEAANPNLIRVISPKVFEMIDESYMHLDPDKAQTLASPGLAPDQILRDAIPGNIVMINCEGDPLLAECEKFKERLEGLGKKVTWWVGEGLGHGWDKSPSFKKGNPTRDEAYKLAVESLYEVWA